MEDELVFANNVPVEKGGKQNEITEFYDFHCWKVNLSCCCTLFTEIKISTSDQISENNAFNGKFLCLHVDILGSVSSNKHF